MTRLQTRDSGGSGGESAGTLGSRVRGFRRGAGLTLEELAHRSGVSRAMISKLERGEKSPTVSVAARVAGGLGLSLSGLLGDAEAGGEVVVVRRERQMVMKDAGSGFERRLLTARSAASGLEFVRNEIPSGQDSGEFPAHEKGTVEYLSVERGTLRASLGGAEYVLQAGDAVTFDADVTHRFDNAGAGVCVYYLVIDHRDAG